MARNILAVIVGYVVMFVLQFVAFMTVYTVMGANWSFKPASYHASTRWTLMQFTVVLLTAVIAGLICALIARGGKAPLALAVVALVIGFALGAAHVATQQADIGELRTANVPNMVAMTKARHPMWVIFAGPVIAAVGILIGGKLKRRS
jgi:heme/copper-type cytochrome/quinol oxidase subunit 3